MGAAQSNTSSVLPSTTTTALPTATTLTTSASLTATSVSLLTPPPAPTTTTVSSASSLAISPSSTAASLPLPYTSTLLPSSTSAPHYIFTYGDSYTSTGFLISGTKPSLNNPLGNPPYPGSTSTGRNATTGSPLPNWLDILTLNAPQNTLTYNFAVGGSSVDNALTLGAYSDTPAFVNQSATFIANLATTPRPSYLRWTAENSVHLIWFGRNDVFWQVSQGADMRGRLDAVIASYVRTVNSLWAAGGRQFVVMGAPSMWLEPVWSSTQLNLVANLSSNVLAPQIQPSVQYWNAQLVAKMKAWKKGKPAVKLSFVDTGAAYARVLDDYQAWGLYSTGCRNDDRSLPVGSICPFADMVHPGPALATSVAIAVGQHLKSLGFLSGFALA